MEGKPLTPSSLETYVQLREFLTRELGYCPCADDDAVPLLADTLRLARDRTDSTKDADAFALASRSLEDRLALNTAPGIASWFVYGLEQRDLIWHGFNLADIWITDKGRIVLEALLHLHPQAQTDSVIEIRIQDEAQEARSWLREEPLRERFLSGCTTEATHDLVESLYRAGAFKVWVTGIAADVDEADRPYEYAGTLFVELPKLAEERRQVLDVCTRFAYGEGSVPDSGRRYVQLWWNNGRPIVCHQAS